MSKNKKVIALMLAALLFVLSFTVSSFAEVDEKSVRAEIESLYQSALRTYKEKTGRSSFYGYCGVYMSYLLNALGIDSYLGGHNGNQWFGAYENGQKLGDYTVIKISGANCIQEIAEKYGEASYVMVSYTHQTHYTDANPGAGHVFFINLISGGKAYFTESYSMYDYSTRSYVKEGKSIVMDINDISEDHQSLYGNAIGALWFVKGELPSAVQSSIKASQMGFSTEKLALYEELCNSIPYKTNSNAKLISNIAAKTRASDFVKSMTEISVTVKDAKGKTVSGDRYIGTGMTASLRYKGEDFPFALSVRGDADGDGVVSSSDARAALRFSARLVSGTLSEAQKAAYDINGDNKVNSVDARQILRVVAKLQSI